MLRGREKILPKDHDPCGSGNKRELACGSGNNRGNTWRVTAEITEEICDSGNHMAGPDPHRGNPPGPHSTAGNTFPKERLFPLGDLNTPLRTRSVVQVGQWELCIPFAFFGFSGKYQHPPQNQVDRSTRSARISFF